MQRAAFAFLGVFLCFSAFAHADEWSKSYNITGKADLRVSTTDAEIRVDTWDRNVVEAHVTSPRTKIGDGIHITDRQNGDRVLEVRMPHHAFNVQIGLHSYRVVIEVHMPRSGNVDLRTEDGAIRVSNLKGNMELNTGDGSVEVSQVDGALRARTGDGRVQADGRFDSLDISTGDGRVEATALAGSRAQGTWSLHTGDGSVELSVPADFAADLDLRTSDGRVNIDLPITVQGHVGDRNIYGKINGGGSLVTVRTGDGSIRIRKT